MKKTKIILFANTDWYLFNFRLSLAEELRSSGHDLLLISPPGDHGEKLLALGFRWLALPMDRRSLNPIREIAFLIYLIRLFRAEAPDIVHGFTIKAAVYAALASKASGVQAIISSVNGLGFVFISDRLKARLLRPLVRLAMRLAFSGKRSRVIVQNPTDRADLLAEGIVRAEDIYLIPGSGVDCEAFHPSKDKTISGGRLRVVLPARMLWDKGVGEFVEASRILSRDDLLFQIAGDIDEGNPAAVSRQQAEVWQTAGYVELLGHVDDMAGLIAAADIVVLPSYREGLPKSLLEASASGKAMIATDVPGCRDVVIDGVNGLIVEVRNSQALANAIDQLANDPGKRDAMGKAARNRAIEEFEKKIIVRQTIEVYRDTLR